MSNHRNFSESFSINGYGYSSLPTGEKWSAGAPIWISRASASMSKVRKSTLATKTWNMHDYHAKHSRLDSRNHENTSNISKVCSKKTACSSLQVAILRSTGAFGYLLRQRHLVQQHPYGAADWDTVASQPWRMALPQKPIFGAVMPLGCRQMTYRM